MPVSLSQWHLRAREDDVVHAVSRDQHSACTRCCDRGFAFDATCARETAVTCVPCLVALIREAEEVAAAALSDADREVLDAERCPDCGSTLWTGPQGGGSMSYHCGNRDCGSEFCYSLSWDRTSTPRPRRPRTP